jgi:very-short-patch-repair endonuclease
MGKRGWRTVYPPAWPKLKPAAKKMRREPTPAEAALWERLRDPAMAVRFRRQHPIEGFVADFVCLRANLVVEVDGGIHEQLKERDAARSEIMDRLGYKTIRFTNDEVLKRTDQVIATIRNELKQRLPQCDPPSPPEKGAGG